jgi:hypothetical protein
MKINLTKKATEHSMENMDMSEGCGCGCGTMTTLTAAEEDCGCGCECCGSDQPKSKDQEYAELTRLRDVIDRRLAELG